MEIDAELRRQIAVSFAAAFVFVAGLVYIGTTYGPSRSLPEDGALAIVGLLAGFVLFMALIGAFLIRANETDVEEPGKDEEAPENDLETPGNDDEN